eukprot:Filipodium_phascolosomae@DN1777_c0_g1_i1.p1
MMLEVLEAAERKGVLFVTAAGNQGHHLGDRAWFPAAYSSKLTNLVTVAAVDYSGDLSPWSNRGDEFVHLAAPGSWVLSTLPSAAHKEHNIFSRGQNNYGFKSGTSMASPHVAAVAALMFATAPSLSVTSAVKILMATTSKNNLDGVLSGGILNAGLSLEAALRIGSDFVHCETPENGCMKGGLCLGGGRFPSKRRTNASERRKKVPPLTNKLELKNECGQKPHDLPENLEGTLGVTWAWDMSQEHGLGYPDRLYDRIAATTEDIEPMEENQSERRGRRKRTKLFSTRHTS